MTFKGLWPSVDWNQNLKILIDDHTHPDDTLTRILTTSDKKDSAENRGTPLFCREQLTGDQRFSSPYGAEKDIPQEQDDLRRKLYRSLNSLLPEYWTLLSTLSDQDPPDRLAEKRDEILTALRQAFSQGVSDTCRPAHDISLWDHAYGTACLFKAYLADQAVRGNLGNPAKMEAEGATRLDKEEAKFALLGFGWDGLSYLEKGEKIGDSVGRRKRLERLKSELRCLVEVFHCLGNRVYEDENGVYFLIPRLTDAESEEGETPSILEPLKLKAMQKAADITYGELPVHIEVRATTEYLSELVAVMEALRRRWSAPWTSDTGAIGLLEWWKGQEGQDREVCPICRLRPTPRQEGDDRKVCRHCMGIREEAKPEWEVGEPQQTIFTGEIVGDRDANPSGKAALLVACFGLREWLNGRMLNTILVKTPGTLEPEIACIKGMVGRGVLDSDPERKDRYAKAVPIIEKFLKTWTTEGKEVDYALMEHLLDRLPPSHDTGADPEGTAFRDLFFYHENQDRLSRRKPFLATLAREAYDSNPIPLANFLCSQNHTPSRLLAIWDETERFFQDFVGDFPDPLKEMKFQPKSRASLTITHTNDIPSGIQGVLELILDDGQRLEVIRRQGEFLTVNAPYDEDLKKRLDRPPAPKIVQVLGEYEKEKHVHDLSGHDCRITGVEPSQVCYYPYRTLLISPLVFMAMVPGSAAVPLAEAMQRRYDERFGKVKGRLPLSVGLVFHREHTPMFAVLDAGKRMIRNFEHLHRQKPHTHKVIAISDSLSTFSTNQLKDRVAIFPGPDHHRDDPHLPYVLIKNHPGPTSPSIRKSYFPTPAGEVVHFSEVQAGDEILAHPNYLDLVFLDATTRRFDLYFPRGEDKRPAAAPHLPPTFPYYLDELADITGLWDRLKESRISDTALRGLEALLLSKLAEWQGVNRRPWESPAWRRLVKSAVARTFRLKYRLEMEEAICNGPFFDTLELYLRVLKERLKVDDQ